MKDLCQHQLWQYCRRVFSNGTQHFGAQCLDCLQNIKLDRHNGRLWIKLEDIPVNAPIHAWMDPDLVIGQGDLFND